MQKLQKKAKVKKLIRNLCKRNSCILVLWADEKSSRNQRFDSSYVLLPMLFLGFLYEKWLSHIASSHFNSKWTIMNFQSALKWKKMSFFSQNPCTLAEHHANQKRIKRNDWIAPCFNSKRTLSWSRGHISVIQPQMKF